MILVVGASGYLGGCTARRLLASGKRVRAAGRVPGKLDALRALGADVVPIDLVDARSIEAACRGVEAVFAAAHSLVGKGLHASAAVDDAGHRALIDAARRAGVQRFVYTSAMFASSDHPVDFMRTKARVEDYLSRSGLRHAILRPTAYMEWHVHNLLGKAIIERNATTIFGPGTNPLNFVAAEDVAAVAAHALSRAEVAGEIIDVGGPDNLSRNAVAALYAERLGRTPRVRHVPLALMRALARIVRPIDPVLARLLAVSVWSETHDQMFVQRPRDDGYPTPATTVREFVAARVDARGDVAELRGAH